MVIAKKYVLTQYFQGEPKVTDLKLVEEELPPLKDGEFLAQAEYLSVDPYMRPYSIKSPLGSTMIGSQVAKVIESKNSNFPVGTKVVGYFGWRTHSIVDPKAYMQKEFAQLVPLTLPSLGDLPSSLGLGVLGMPGNTAYFGFLEICKPQEGETVVISGAAGAVGSHVGQIAKNVIGMHVVGIAGSDEKCKWIVETLGFDAAINYKTEDLTVALKKAAPKGIDCYFDNVGGETSSTVINQMNHGGRVSVCGSISSYNHDLSSLPKCTPLQGFFIFNELKMEGFMVTRWFDRSPEAIQKNLQWIREGKLRYRETITDGFENMFNAFVGMLRGENIGKAIVKV